MNYSRRREKHILVVINTQSAYLVLHFRLTVQLTSFAEALVGFIAVVRYSAYRIYLLCGIFTQELSIGSNEPSSGYITSTLNYVMVIAPNVPQHVHI